MIFNEELLKSRQGKEYLQNLCESLDLEPDAISAEEVVMAMDLSITVKRLLPRFNNIEVLELASFALLIIANVKKPQKDGQ